MAKGDAMTFTSWFPTLPPVRPPQDIGLGVVTGTEGLPPRPVELLPDPDFGGMGFQDEVPMFSTSANSITGLIYSDGSAAVPIGWYSPTTGPDPWTMTFGVGSGIGSRPGLLVETTQPLALRPAAYDSVDNPTGGLAVRIQPEMYYTWEMKARVASTVGTPQAGVQMGYANWDASHVEVPTTAEMVALTTAFQTLRLTGIIPSTFGSTAGDPPAHLMPEIVFALNSTAERFWYVADASLTVEIHAPDDFLAFSHGGNLSTGAGTFKLPFMEEGTVIAAKAAVGTAPTGSAITLDINRNGTTIYGTTSVTAPTISTGATVGANATAVPTTMAVGDYLTVDIDQVGSSTPGADLTVMVQWRRA